MEDVDQRGDAVSLVAFLRRRCLLYGHRRNSGDDAQGGGVGLGFRLNLPSDSDWPRSLGRSVVNLAAISTSFLAGRV